MMLAVPAAFGEIAHVLYLMDEDIPDANLEVDPPTGPLINLDPGRDDELGLFLVRSSKGSDDTRSPSSLSPVRPSSLMR